MKRKFFKSIIIAAGGLLVFAACSKNFLETDPTGTPTENNYYRDETEAFNGLVAVYDVVGWQGNGYITKTGMADAASDDHYAGGGSSTDVSALQVMSNYTVDPATGPSAELWQKGYAGVFRANLLMEKLPNVPMDENKKKRFVAESKVLRAYFYFDLVRLFKNIPLLTKTLATSEFYNVLQADPAAVWAQIEKDLTEAIAETQLPDKLASNETGRMNKGIAHALLGKVYLWEKKYTEAAAEFALVNGTPGGTSSYGYSLLPNYADLWKFTNKFNAESIFEVSFSSLSGGAWSCTSCTEGNVLNVMVGPRGYNPTPGAPDYYSGWSFLPVTQSLFDALHFDPRFNATILNLDSLEKNGIAKYEKGYMNTGYFLAKFAAKNSDRTTGGGNVELNFGQNLYEIRLADAYLMEAEALVRGGGDAGRADALLNAVRKRVGLNPVSATIDNIMKERRLELAGEGHRWFDLVRTGDAATVLATKGFKPGKNEILPIPLQELENTKILQNKEYGGTK